MKQDKTALENVKEFIANEPAENKHKDIKYGIEEPCGNQIKELKKFFGEKNIIIAGKNKEYTFILIKRS